MPKRQPFVTLSTLAGHRVMAQHKGTVRLRNDNNGRECVVNVSRNGHRVQSCTFDSPNTGGQWHSAATPSGIDYVASWVSPSTARRRFKCETGV
jgi:hypothetical protein